LQVTLSQIVKEAFEIDAEGFVQIVEHATNLLRNENGKIGNFEITGRLIRLKPLGEALIISDLHGDLESLIEIFKKSGFLQKMSQAKDAILIFLGDYGDRGDDSAEIYYTVLKLKLLFPEQAILMRGNHEGPEDLMASPHDLPYQFQTRFGEKWAETYDRIRELFNYLYNAVLVEERYLIIHGGPPLKANTIEDLAYAHIRHPKQSFLEDMLWSDPNEMIGYASASPRGAGKLFGQKVTDEALKKFGVHVLIRGHEPCEEGFKIDHKGKVLTLFSRKGSPYFNSFGAYLDVKLSERIENAEQLVPYIHKF
jgi:protein phosphatase